MIVDTVENMKLYYPALPQLKEVYGFVAEYLAQPKPAGKYVIDGDSLFVNVCEYTTSQPQGKLPEAHRKYADVQVVVSGRECIGWAPLSTLTEQTEEFSKGGDIGFYSGKTQIDTVLEAGCFALLLPQDAHMPCVAVDGAECEVTKLVFKILL